MLTILYSHRLDQMDLFHLIILYQFFNQYYKNNLNQIINQIIFIIIIIIILIHIQYHNHHLRPQSHYYLYHQLHKVIQILMLTIILPWKNNIQNSSFDFGWLQNILTFFSHYCWMSLLYWSFNIFISLLTSSIYLWTFYFFSHLYLSTNNLFISIYFLYSHFFQVESHIVLLSVH